ncbi:hypothetical protein J6590_077318 [Homalodisca vitripennis]|nr:hypothetical protein J6590_077318 [Homalodisca vitripennis]
MDHLIEEVRFRPVIWPLLNLTLLGILTVNSYSIATIACFHFSTVILYLRKCEWHSIALDESTDVSDTAQVLFINGGVNSDAKSIKEFTDVFPWKARLRVQDAFSKVNETISKYSTGRPISFAKSPSRELLDSLDRKNTALPPALKTNLALSVDTVGTVYRYLVVRPNHSLLFVRKHNGPDPGRSAMEDIDLEEATLDNHTLRDRHTDTALLSAHKIVYDDQARKYTDTPSSLVYIKGYKIAYTAPSTVSASCDVIMKAVQATLGKNTKVTMVSQPDENSVVNWLRQQYIDENGNSDSIFGNSDLSAGVGVIFADSSSTSLKYTLRTTKETLFQTSEDTLYGEQSRGIGLSLYQSSGFLSVQAAIDQAYLASQQGISFVARNSLSKSCTDLEDGRGQRRLILSKSLGESQDDDKIFFKNIRAAFTNSAPLGLQTKERPPRGL